MDEAAKKKEKEGLKFDGRTCLSWFLGGLTSLFCAVWGADPPNSKYGFEDDVSACAAYSGGTHLTNMCADQTLVRHTRSHYPSSLTLSSYFSGFKNKDVAFFHPASKTMIEADLLFNLPATEQVR